MKPIKLVMKNFGPFLDETIDFNELNEHQMFLITGKTGSGKTTIFDAMLYSLYGKASTEARDEKSLPSQFATDEEKSFYVSFEFKMHHKHYVVYRDLPNVKSNKASIHEIINEEKIPLVDQSKKKLVNEKIKEIIQLELNQFKQIFILPQGEFKRMLVSTSNEKGQILSQLFNTERFKKITERLKQSVNHLKDERKNLEQQMQNIMDLTLPSDIQDYEAAKIQLESDEAKFNQKLEKINTDIQSNKQQLSEIQQEMMHAKQLNESIVQLKNVKEKLNTIYASKDQITALEKQLQRLTQRIQYQSIHQEKLQIDSEIAALNVMQEEIQSTLKQLNLTYNDFENEHNTLLKQTVDIERKNTYVIQNQMFLHQNFKSLAMDMDKLQKSITSINELLSSIAYDPDTLSSHQTFLSDKTNEKFEKFAQYNEQKTIVSDLQTKLNAINDDIHVVKAIQIFEEKKQSLLKELEMIEINIQSLKLGHQSLNDKAIMQLRNGLEIGQKCPVCSQVIAEKIENTDDIKKHHEWMKQYQSNQNEIAKIDTKIEMKKEQLRHAPNTSFASLAQQKSAIQGQLNDATINLNKTEDEIALINEAIDETKMTIEQLKVQETNYHHQTQLLQSSTQQYDQLIQKRTQFETQTGFKVYSLFEQQMKEHETEIKNYKTKLSKIEQFIEQSIASQKETQEKLLQLTYNKQALMKQMEQLNVKLVAIDLPIQYQNETTDVSQLADEKNTVEKEIKQYENEKYALNQQYEQLQMYENEALINIEPLKAQETMCLTALEQLHGTKDEWISSFAVFKERLTQFNQAFQIYMDKIKHQADLFILADSFQGINQRNISLENYVLQYYLDQVLIEANKRLRIMSDYRYQLKRKTNDYKRNQKNGLDIVVYDVHSNAERDISSLSGGETFLASLSLALGLSDYVRQISGGIQFDAVFIDEGFGTLDSDTLDTAIEALFELQRHGKIIGIISHVERLKEMMPAMLKVTSNGSTSVTQFITK